jgi:hypothetical protein
LKELLPYDLWKRSINGQGQKLKRHAQLHHS